MSRPQTPPEIQNYHYEMISPRDDRSEKALSRVGEAPVAYDGLKLLYRACMEDPVPNNSAMSLQTPPKSASITFGRDARTTFVVAQPTLKPSVTSAHPKATQKRKLSHDNAPTTASHKGVKQPRYWTTEEHDLFLEALDLYGPKNVKAISQHVGTRTHTQVRTHAQKYYLRLDTEGKEMPLSSQKLMEGSLPSNLEITSGARPRPVVVDGKMMSSKAQIIANEKALRVEGRRGSRHLGVDDIDREAPVGKYLSLAGRQAA